MEIEDQAGFDQPETTSASPDTGAVVETPQQDRALVERIQKTILADRRHHEKAFKRMRKSMFMATHGRDEDWVEKNYKANIAGRHVRQKTNALYAKNPKVVARVRERLDYRVWNGDQQSLLMAMQMVQQATAALSTMPAQFDPVTGQQMPPQYPPGYEQAVALIEDFQQGYAREQSVKKLGRTLEILMQQQMREQNPVDFKTGAKQCVRRACTTAVGYVELGFQRETGPASETVARLTDARQRIQHLERLAQEAAEGEFEAISAETAELQRAVQALQQEPEIVLRAGLTFDWLPSTSVVPDRRASVLTGFVGAQHLTVQRMYTPNEIKEIFGADLKNRFTPYSAEGKRNGKSASNGGSNFDEDDQHELPLGSAPKSTDQLVCVWKHYDRPSGLVYHVADGHPNFLRDPAPPDVFVSDFFPVYALTFNAVENEDDLFPPSDVELVADMQNEINRSRQGQREHRMAARPRWVSPPGAIDETGKTALAAAEPFTVTEVAVDGDDISKALQPVPVPGVDPNLYETNQFFTDMQLTVGSSPARLGGLAKATATESAIAESSASADDTSGIDDLDAWLTAIARGAGQILLREMPPEKVAEVVGPGAVWPGLEGFPEMSLGEIADELWLEVEAGSTGKPNQAIEIQNWKEMLPFLLQMGEIRPSWLARETLRRLDDRMDLTEAIAEGLPSIMAMNRMAGSQVSPTADPNADPNQQGDRGGERAPAPGGSGGSGPAFGSNQV